MQRRMQIATHGSGKRKRHRTKTTAFEQSCTQYTQCQLVLKATQLATSGPVALAVKTVRTKSDIAGPRVRFGQRSATTPAAVGPSMQAAVPWIHRQKMSE